MASLNIKLKKALAVLTAASLLCGTNTVYAEGGGNETAGAGLLPTAVHR